MLKKLLIILVMLAFITPFSIFSWGVSPEIWNSYFNTWDMDKNNLIDPVEFENGFMAAGLFSKWDTDGDGRLGTSEFYALAQEIFNTWDTNSDGELYPNEFVYSAMTKGIDGAWDKNSDGQINIDEFRTGLYDKMDTNQDGFLDPKEVATGLFQLLDVDADNHLTRTQFNAGSGATAAQ